MRGYRSKVRRRGLQVLQPASAGLVFVEAVSNRPPQPSDAPLRYGMVAKFTPQTTTLI